MSTLPSYAVPSEVSPEETTGRCIVTFQQDGLEQGLSALDKICGISNVSRADEFSESAFDMAEIDSSDAMVLPTLGIAVAKIDEDVSHSLREEGAILSVEPERMFYALTSGNAASCEWLRGYRDAANAIYEEMIGEAGVEAAVTYVDDAHSTWGLKATDVVNSSLTGRKIRVAVLDTGMDLNHPDFVGRPIISNSFIPGQSVQDGNGHGTHCIGTACGRKDANGRRYGVAGGSQIVAGKVLSNSGSGLSSGILAGIEWALNQECQVISMSLGNRSPVSSPAYEAAGKRALQRGSLIIASAGNHGPRTVGQPANSPSILAVAALDNRLRSPVWSCPSGPSPGSEVDIAAPGVAVYSSWPLNVSPNRYHTISGTSMAAPHVSGIAALCAESSGARGQALWNLVVSKARALSLPTSKVGSGLAQACN